MRNLSYMVIQRHNPLEALTKTIPGAPENRPLIFTDDNSIHSGQAMFKTGMVFVRPPHGSRVTEQTMHTLAQDLAAGLATRRST